MLPNLLANLIPAARHLRGPAVAGLMWLLFAWLLITWRDVSFGRLGERAEAVVDFLGVTPTLTLISIFIFVVGAVSTDCVAFASLGIGAMKNLLDNGLAWQRTVRKGKRALKSELRKRKRDLETYKRLAKSYEEQQYDYQIRTNTEAMNSADKTLASLSALSEWWGLWTPRTEAAASALGKLAKQSKSREDEVAELAIRDAYDSALGSQLDAMGYLGDHEEKFGDFPWYQAVRLVEEFHPDPLESLRALNSELFVQMDRERGEREFRVAISAPLIALAALGMAAISWWFLSLAILATLLLVSNSLSPAGERARVLNQVVLRGLETPAIRAAAVAGRSRARALVPAKPPKPEANSLSANGSD